MQPVWSITPSSAVSMPVSVAVPALNTEMIARVGRSTITDAVVLLQGHGARGSAELMPTYSGSGSVGSCRPAAAKPGRALPSPVVNGTGVTVHAAGRPGEADHLEEPAGRLREITLLGAGRSELLVPLVLDHDRGVRAVRADGDRVGLPAEANTERTRSRSAIRMTSSRPEGAVKDGLVSTTTSA